MAYWIQIASVPDRNSVVAEIYVDDAQFAEVRRERSALHVEIYAIRSGAAWDI